VFPRPVTLSFKHPSQSTNPRRIRSVIIESALRASCPKLILIIPRSLFPSLLFSLVETPFFSICVLCCRCTRHCHCFSTHNILFASFASLDTTFPCTYSIPPRSSIVRLLFSKTSSPWLFYVAAVGRLSMRVSSGAVCFTAPVRSSRTTTQTAQMSTGDLLSLLSLSHSTPLSLP
jgi:hypothetical protein